MVVESTVETIVVFVVSLLIGALGIYIGARVITGVDNYWYAIITALLGAIVWGIVSLFFGWIPLLGPIIVLLAYLAVINWRYPGGWGDAILITLIAWISVVVVLYVLNAVGLIEFGAFGVPGT